MPKHARRIHDLVPTVLSESTCPLPPEYGSHDKLNMHDIRNYMTGLLRDLREHGALTLFDE